MFVSAQKRTALLHLLPQPEIFTLSVAFQAEKDLFSSDHLKTFEAPRSPKEQKSIPNSLLGNVESQKLNCVPRIQILKHLVAK